MHTLIKDGVTKTFLTIEEFDEEVATYSSAEDNDEAAEAKALYVYIQRIRDAQEFANNLYTIIAARQLRLGINTETFAKQKAVDTATEIITAPLRQGKLPFVIAAIKTYNSANFDGKYITAASLLKLRNAVHKYLNLAPVNTYNE